MVIRGIPKEGWKLSAGGGVGVSAGGVVIRGIPKEGWKQMDFMSFSTPLLFYVVIRGIPKEGWKLAYRSLSASFIAISVGQKSLNGDVTHQLSIRIVLFLFLACLLSCSCRL